MFIVLLFFLLFALYISPKIFARNEPKLETKTGTDIPVNLNRKIGDIVFIYVQSGRFRMGSREAVAKNDELPVHEVYLDSFLISRSEITQQQYKNITDKYPSKAVAVNPDPERLPVDSITWYDALEFCKKFGQKYGVTARLPYEAEWEYAARAGTSTKYYWGDEADYGYCWFRENSKLEVHNLCEKTPNAWGLYDIAGNLWEWCMDWYDENYYKTSPGNNPRGPAEGQYKILRGGSWESQKYSLRSANRQRTKPDDYGDDAGFRMVIEIKAPK